MIQWIALAVAVDANGKASDARNKADEANYKSGSGSPLVIVRPVDLESVPVREPNGFWDHLLLPYKKVLAKAPWATLSIKKSDILNLREYTDADGAKYVLVRISKYAQVYRGEGHVAGFYVPGTIEQVAGAIGGI